MMCQADWFDVYGQRALDHFGRITQPRVLTQDAWRKSYDWRSEGGHNHYVYNHLTEERRPITEQQFNDEQVITEDGRLAI